MTGVRFVIVLLTAFSACRSDHTPEPGHDVPPAHLLLLAKDALKSGAEIRISGNQDSVIRSHPLSPAFLKAMEPHFQLMQKLNSVADASGIRFSRYRMELKPERYCGDSTSAALLASVMMRFDMESIGQSTGVPPYTAYSEEHVFRFVRLPGEWTMSSHHEITLAEMHDPETLKRLRAICQPR